MKKLSMAVCVCVIAAFALFGGSTRDSQLSVATAAAQPQAAALSLVDRGLAGPAGPDDEGQYRLIDPIGPGGASDTAAQNEVFAPTMIGGQYTRWRPYHDPFAGGGYGGVQAPEGAP